MFSKIRVPYSLSAAGQPPHAHSGCGVPGGRIVAWPTVTRHPPGVLRYTWITRIWLLARCPLMMLRADHRLVATALSRYTRTLMSETVNDSYFTSGACTAAMNDDLLTSSPWESVPK